MDITQKPSNVKINYKISQINGQLLALHDIHLSIFGHNAKNVSQLSKLLSKGTEVNAACFTSLFHIMPSQFVTILPILDVRMQISHHHHRSPLNVKLSPTDNYHVHRITRCSRKNKVQRGQEMNLPRCSN